MIMLSRIPIRYLLIIIVMIGAIPAAGIIVDTTFQQRKAAINTACADTLQLAERIAFEHQGMVESAHELMSSLSQMPAIKRKDAAHATSLLRDLLEFHPEYTNIFVADRTGFVWATAVPVKPPFIVSDRRYFRNAIASGQFSSGEYIIDREGNRPSLTFGYPIKGKRGEVTGVIGLGFLLEKYSRLLHFSKLPKNASFTLWDHKGVILYRAIEPEKFIGKKADPAQFKEMQEGPDESTVIGKSIAVGDERIVSTKKLRLEGEPSPYMYVRPGIPVASALADANTQLAKNVTLFGLIIFGSVLFASFIGKRFIVAPLEILDEASQMIEKGSYQNKVADLAKGNELGRLAKSFDSMSKTLQQREMALADSERFLKTIIDSEPECIKLLDSNCNLLLMNTAGLKMIDADSFDQVKGQCMSQLITSPYRDAFIALTKQVFQGIPGSLEFEAVGLKGRHVWLDTHAVPFCNENGGIVSLLGITRDVTERKKSDKNLQNSEAKFSAIFRTSPDSININRLDDAVFVDVNDGFTAMLGYTTDDVIGKSSTAMGIWVNVEDRALLARQLKEIGWVINLEASLRRKDGSLLTALISSRLIELDGVLCTLNIARDITELRHAEHERQKHEIQMLHTQKLESLGVLAGGIAHDFNNILTSIVGNTELALMQLNPESPAIDNLHRIEKSAARATDLARQMLAYSGKGKFVIEAIDLNRLIEEMGHMLDVSISKRVTLQYNLSQKLPSIEVDTTQIRQVVMNLVINASEAMGENNGVVAISTGCMDCDDNYLNAVTHINNIKAGRYIYLEVTDTGCGMDNETMAKVFDPFFTTKFTGRGLGMAAVQGIVRGHKGFINVSSELGKGTTFKVFLPASDQVVDNETPSIRNEEWRGQGKVLLVDDEKDVRGIGKAMLQKLGFTVITANDGNEAVELFRVNSDIAFVILDLTMPLMDGEQCFYELLRIKPDTKVVMSSGFSEQEVTQKFMGKGLSGFIQKPYKISAIKEAIQKI